MRLLIFLTVFAAFVGSSLAVKNQICALPHSHESTPPCRADLPRWTYDSNNKECIKFFYGGCGGNDNRFDSKETCKEQCLE